MHLSLSATSRLFFLVQVEELGGTEEEGSTRVTSPGFGLGFPAPRRIFFGVFLI